MKRGGKLRLWRSVPLGRSKPVPQFLLSAFLPGVALLICFVFEKLLTPSFDATFIASIAITAWVCGLLPGLLSILFSAVALTHYFLPVSGLNEATRLGFFTVTSGVVVLLIHNFSQTQNDLEESEERFRNAADLIPFGGWTADESGNMTHLSDSFLSAFQTTLLRCSDLGWIRLIAPEQQEQVRTAWLRCVQSGRPWDYEYRMAPVRNQSYVILSRGIPLHDSNGKIRSWVGIHLDVTERQRLEQDRLEQAREIARSNAELDQFAYIAAHDLQEPLRMIASYVQLIAKRYRSRLDPEADEFIDYAVDGAARLKQLLQGVQLLSYVGKVPERRTVTALAPLAENAAVSVRQRHPNVEFSLDVAPMPSARCDSFEYTQLFEHLLDNAVKFRRADVPLHIRITVDEERNFHRIRVADNGIGINPEYQERIFEVFQRLHGRDEYPGTGIGLAICKKIVEVHGGRIWAESNPDGGTTINFTLPH